MSGFDQRSIRYEKNEGSQPTWKGTLEVLGAESVVDELVISSVNLIIGGVIGFAIAKWQQKQSTKDIERLQQQSAADNAAIRRDNQLIMRALAKDRREVRWLINDRGERTALIEPVYLEGSAHGTSTVTATLTTGHPQKPTATGSDQEPPR